MSLNLCGNDGGNFFDSEALFSMYGNMAARQSERRRQQQNQRNQRSGQRFQPYHHALGNERRPGDSRSPSGSESGSAAEESNDDSDRRYVDEPNNGEDEDGRLLDVLPDPSPAPAPMSSAQLRSLRGPRGDQPDRMSEAQRRRNELVNALGFEPEVAKNSWKSRSLCVPGTHNPMADENANKHGPNCPLCVNLPEASDDAVMFNHMNVINAIISAAGNHMANVDALAHMIASYWNENVASEGVVPVLDAKMVAEHIDSIVLDGMMDAAKMSRNLEAMQNVLMAHLVSENRVTGETRINSQVAQLLMKLPQAKRIIHETNWSKSSLSIPCGIHPDAIRSVAPLVKIFSS